MLVGEVHHCIHLALHLLAIDKDVIAAIRHLQRQKRGWRSPRALLTTLLPFVFFSSKAHMLNLGSSQGRARDKDSVHLVYLGDGPREERLRSRLRETEKKDKSI